MIWVCGCQRVTQFAQFANESVSHIHREDVEDAMKEGGGGGGGGVGG